MTHSGDWRVLVVGSGGREHTLAWKLSQSDSVAEVTATPGNPGMTSLGPTYDVGVDDVDGLVALQTREKFDLVVIGPEAPLAAGLADRLRAEGAAVFGPGANGAQLEASKAFAKEFMTRHDVPTARYRVAGSLAEARSVLEEWGAPIVVKASGLAAGKGVTVAETTAAADAALVDCFEGDAFGTAGATVVLEEKLAGEEVSLLILTDGTRYTVLPASQDHKRAFDGDRGPNTGGMGAYSPAPVFTEELRDAALTRIVEPTLAGLRAEGIEFRGLLYVGLMLTGTGPQVVEYNVRFGDPETQVVLPRIEGDLAAWMMTAARGRLEAPLRAPEAAGAAVCVVAATGDYPRSSSKGLVITGIEEAEALGARVFQAGTARVDGQLVTAGGRVLGVTAAGETLEGALAKAYGAVERIHFDGVRWRKDIAHRALAGTVGGSGGR